MKKCNKCGIEKSSSEFYKNSLGKQGLRSECKPCNRLFKAHSPEKKAHYRLKGEYGIGMPEYLTILEKQSNKCLICETTTCKSGKRFSVDHNHITGEIRGLLCNSCNTGLGKFHDTPELLMNAYQYLITKGHYGQEATRSP